MPSAPRHPREGHRALAVQSLRMLGTPAEERFDKITRLAKRLFNVPVAAIDFVGEKAVWVKSVQGADVTDVVREDSYCQHALWTGRDKPCEIEDARIDPRTVDNPNRNHFVFYAGVPIHHDGLPVGVLCICGYAPRKLTVDEFAMLRDLADLAERELSIVSLTEEQLQLAEERDAFEVKALVDTLTRVWNRGAIMELAARELQAGLGAATPTAVLLLDIDHFKKVNDTYGHPAGDEVLRQVSARIRAAVRPNDAVGRYGGEEFLIVLPVCPLASLAEVAERIREDVCREPIECAPDTSISVTISIGGTVSKDGGHFVEILVKAADLALYRAKNEGRNRVSIEASPPSRLMRKVVPPS